VWKIVESIKEIILTILKERRTVPEIIRLAREKYGKNISPSAVYYHLKRIEDGKELGLKLNKLGDTYQVISQQVDDTYLDWFVEKYEHALKEKDHVELFLLREEMFYWSQKTKNEKFLEFVIENAKRDSFQYFESIGINLQGFTLITWDCIQNLAINLKWMGEERILKRIEKTKGFFKKVILDKKRYGIERIKAFSILEKIGPLPIDIVFELLATIEPNKKILFAPHSKEMNEHHLFRCQIRSSIRTLALQQPLVCRKKLFEIYELRRKNFGEKDKVIREILEFLEWTKTPLVK